MFGSLDAREITLPFIAVVIVVFVSPTASRAQKELHVDGAAECTADCFDAEVVQLIESPDSVGLEPFDLLDATATETGEVWIAPVNWPGRLVVFREGRVSTTLGRHGDGPGESRHTSFLALGPADSVHAFGLTGRNVFTGPGFQRSQRHRFIPIQSNLVYEKGEVHLATLPPTFGREQARLLLLARDAPADAEGQPIDVHDASTTEGNAIVLDTSARTCLAIGRRGRYRLDVFDESMQAVVTVRRSTPWFQAWDEWTPPLEAPPRPRMMSVRIDCDTNRVWAQFYVAEDDDFEPLDTARMDDPQGEGNRTYDTLVEVIDLTRGVVLASQRFDATLGPFLPGGQVLEPFLTESGEQGFRLLRLTLSSDATASSGNPGPR